MSKTKTYKSDALAAVHPVSAEETKALRDREEAS